MIKKGFQSERDHWSLFLEARMMAIFNMLMDGDTEEEILDALRLDETQLMLLSPQAISQGFCKHERLEGQIPNRCCSNCLMMLDWDKSRTCFNCKFAVEGDDPCTVKCDHPGLPRYDGFVNRDNALVEGLRCSGWEEVAQEDS